MNNNIVDNNFMAQGNLELYGKQVPVGHFNTYHYVRI